MSWTPTTRCSTRFISIAQVVPDPEPGWCYSAEFRVEGHGTGADGGDSGHPAGRQQPRCLDGPLPHRRAPPERDDVQLQRDEQGEPEGRTQLSAGNEAILTSHATHMLVGRRHFRRLHADKDERPDGHAGAVFCLEGRGNETDVDAGTDERHDWAADESVKVSELPLEHVMLGFRVPGDDQIVAEFLHVFEP